MTVPPPSERSRRALAEEARGVLDQVAADGVGVTVLLPGGPVYSGATPFTTLVDDVQYELMEGPCLTAADSADVVRFDLRASDDHRWPRFRAAVTPLSLRVVVSAPLMAADRPIGSLNLYSTSDDGLSDLGAAEALRLAARLQPAVRNIRTLCVAESNARLLRQAGRDHRDIEGAVAWLMQHYATNAREGRILLGQIGRERGTSEADTARRILAEHDRPSPS